MRRLDASPRRAAPKGHETFISRAASFSHRLLPRATPFRAHGAKCRVANVGAVAALGPSRMPGSPGAPRCTRGRSVETPRYVELPHVLRVPYFHVLQSFHDHWPAHDATAALAGGPRGGACAPYPAAPAFSALR